ncbi:hypothetical protein [Promicromonospora soli]|uniref:Uncharacterized protein n=1 Tax=Promicromonospora soli TaxID=2035533 RepID=A0A919G5B3_9MICO|nr:hypothetical protein [Promicromonospora soli]GHH78044.1 hypothetical protein GCM10017772_40630 [Promicromonospora soli]
MTPRLQAALDAVDHTFDGFTCAADNPCTHCYGDRDEGLPELTIPGTLLAPDLLDSLAYRTPSLFTDHAAMVRRILPQMARRLADGTLHTYWPEQHCLARSNWREWPTSQADAIRELIEAWWEDLVTTREPHHDIALAFATFAAVTGDLAAALASWPDDDTANRHLVTVSRGWIDDLINDEDPSTSCSSERSRRSRRSCRPGT